jgi:ferredoxin-nitrite reductase
MTHVAIQNPGRDGLSQGRVTLRYRSRRMGIWIELKDPTCAALWWHARELGDYLDGKVTLDQPINIHLTGRPHSCAQHYMGDIGLLAAKVKVSGEPVEGYHVLVGGGFGKHQAIGRQVFKRLSFEQVKETLRKMLQAFQDRRQENETFRDYTQPHDLNTLQQNFDA